MMKRYLMNTSGNVAMMFSVTALVMLMGIGLAIDYSGAASRNSELQRYVDAAVLAAGKSRLKDEGELSEIVDATIAAHNLENWDITAVTKVKNDQVSVVANLKYDTSLMGIFGKKVLDISVDSGSPIATKTPINLALVLDTTGSMAGSNMADLIAASEDLADQLDEMKTEVRASLVPFGEYVNVGPGNKGEPWLDTSKDGLTETTYECWKTRDIDQRGVCTPTGREISAPIYSDGVQTGMRTYDEQTCTDNTYMPERDECRDITRTYTWHGCVNSRPDPYNMEPEYNSRQIPAHYNDPDKCGAEIIPLTNNMGDIKTGIQNLEARGETYLPAGLMWGWRTLDESQPFTQASSSKKGAVNAILLMTDGANTRNLMSNGTHSGSNGATGLAKTKGVCDKIKAAGIQIFTVGYRLPGSADDTSEVLDYCASSPGQSFNADNAAELTASFESIGSMLDSVRISY
ncbi:VWA domain-containing protein [Litorimonas sp. RW-G-Af-16]|uniref:VWA domain-containing protein n=1 Tax=Litorimonas sp. RW-G-Af-16 TaxID=3241168 RepID=UPI003AAE401D